MKQYLDLLEDILENGEERDDRTGVGTISVFGRSLRFNLKDGFPAVTTKKLAWRSVVSELLWFLEGSTNEHRLAEIKNDNKPYDQLTESEKKTIWTLNYQNQGKQLGYGNGELGPIYGYNWRHWKALAGNGHSKFGKTITYAIQEFDQLTNVINEIKNNPHSRRLLVSAWNVPELENMALPPCHYSFQFYVSGPENQYLSLMWNQRSADACCGIPFNISSYALLLNIIAKMTGKIPLELVGNFGDTHIYKNHIDSAKVQLKRTPHQLPQLKMPDLDYQNMTLDEILKSVKVSDFELLNYEHDEPLKFEMAV